jgi:alpha-L-fucosidase
MDWHHPDYLPRRGWEINRSDEGADMQRFRKYLHGQVTELLTNYGPVGIMWFDGEWESTWRGAYGKELYELCVTLQPEVIVNNRLGARGGMSGLTGMDGYAGGYGGDYMTPEQEIPDAVDKGIDWETCMTMNDRWGYNMHDKNFKSTTDLLRKLSDIVSKNGNFLLNIGPKADGTFPDESIQRLSEIGDWMDVNGEAIHGTIGSPFSELSWGRATQKFHNGSTTVYMHVFDWPSDGKLVIPGLAGRVKSAKVLGGNHVTFTKGEGEVIVNVPSEMPNDHIGVIAIEVHGKPVVYEVPTINALSNEFVHDVKVSLAVGSEDLEIRYSLNDDTTYAVFHSPITLDETTTIHARSYDRGKPVSSLVSKTFKKIPPRQPAKENPLNRGTIHRAMFEGSWDVLPDFSTLSPVAEEIVTSIHAPEGEYVAYVFSGLLYVASDDMFMFALSSDDGSRLLIGNDVVIDNDGLHGTQEKRGAVALAKGWHEFRVEWFNKTGGASLDVEMGVVGGELKSIPSTSLSAEEASRLGAPPPLSTVY